MAIASISSSRSTTCSFISAMTASIFSRKLIMFVLLPASAFSFDRVKDLPAHADRLERGSWEKCSRFSPVNAS